MAIKPVKHFLSSHAGAPVLTGVAGGLIPVLDACLVNGFNLITLDSLVVVDGVLTGTKAGHGFVPDQVIATSANESNLIGEWTVTTVTSNTFSAVATGVTNATGTGTLSAKAAPLGWSKVFSGTNKAVYRSNDVESCRMYLRVDDTSGYQAYTTGYETMADVDTGTGRFPTQAQASSGLFWSRSASSNSTARLWKLAGNSKIFHFFPRVDIYTYTTHHYTFGDFVSEKQGDAFNCIIVGHTNQLLGVGYGSIGVRNFNSSGMFIPRSFNQLGGAVTASTGCAVVAEGSGVAGNPAYPALTNNGLILCGIIMRETTANVIRALSIPGVHATPQTLPLVDGDFTPPMPTLSDRKLLATSIGLGGSEGRLFVDITGPW